VVGAVGLAAAGPAPAQPAASASSAADSLGVEEAREAAGARPVIRKVRLKGGDDHVARTGPGEGYAIAAVVPPASVFRVIAKSGDWFNVQLSGTRTGWIHASLCEEFDDVSELEFRPNPRLYSRVGAFVLTGYGGAYAFDRKSNSLVLGGRIGYYVFDFLCVEGGLSWSHISRSREIVESLFGLSLEAEDFHMLFYSFNLAVELLPGRQMVPFVTGGVGSTIMQGKSEPSFNYGAGTTLFLSKRTAMRWEVRNHRFESGSENARRRNNNVEFSLGTALVF
jgi:outer membrane beta-barrel protein